jgi:rare lipoprotein A
MKLISAMRSAAPGCSCELSPSVRPHTVLRRLFMVLLVMLGAALLSACGSSPKPVADQGGSVAAPTTGTPGSVASTSPRRGGGYYKDDGPDEVPPANLDAVPDAEPRAEPLHRFANRPYHVLGQSFVPATELRPFRQRGHASWYGRRFHGNPTSSGEPYDMYAMTAAHPTLPIPSYVRVTRLDTGRSVVVRVNDRGPFLRGRVIDLSYTAAHKLGYINAGSAEVEVEQILPGEAPLIASTRAIPPLAARANEGVVAADVPRPLPPLPLPAAAAESAAAAVVADVAGASAPPPAAAGIAPPIASASAGIYLQLGAFASYANAEGFRDSVQSQAASLAQRFELLADGERFRLHAGPYESVDAARSAAERMGTVLKLKPFVIVR